MGIGNSKDGKLEEIIKVNGDGSILKYKTSIYGWGKLQHPVKPQDVAKPKKKTKWVDPLSTTNQNATVASDSGNLKIQSSNLQNLSKSVENLVRFRNGDASSREINSSKRQSVPNTTRSLRGVPQKNGGNASATKKWTLKSFRSDEAKKRSSAIVIQQNKVGNIVRKSCFYGRYRCKTCQRYWRSGLAQVGVSQKCSKCATPTFPER